ncbi:MAG: hypothetical protein KC431_28865, partial [Myxococcales bacterium]|nr:hypothetical protein [Myxococcales bacterium]
GEGVELLHAHLDRSLPELPRPGGAPVEVEALLHLALAKDPEERFANIEEFSTTWMALSDVAPPTKVRTKTRAFAAIPPSGPAPALAPPPKYGKTPDPGSRDSKASSGSIMVAGVDKRTQLGVGPSTVAPRRPPKLITPDGRKPVSGRIHRPSAQPTEAVPALPTTRVRQPSAQPTEAVPALNLDAEVPRKGPTRKARVHKPSAQATEAVPALGHAETAIDTTAPAANLGGKRQPKATVVSTTPPPVISTAPTDVAMPVVPAVSEAPAPASSELTDVPQVGQAPARSEPLADAAPKRRRLGKLEIAIILFLLFDILVFLGAKVLKGDDDEVADEQVQKQEQQREPAAAPDEHDPDESAPDEPEDIDEPEGIDAPGGADNGNG